MAVNIDEGEPGTFKDRYYLERDPHRFLEGMLIAAWAVGIDDVYVYLRDEYAGVPRDPRARDRRARRRIRRCALPPIHLRRGAGALHLRRRVGDDRVDRGQARHAAAAPAVRRAGRAVRAARRSSTTWRRSTGCATSSRGRRRWFAGHGRHGRKGLRSFSVSGRVAKPGVHLAPAGITVRELIDEYCGGMLPGHEFYGYLPGGASGGILPASLGDIPLDFDTLQPHGSLHRLGGGHRAVAARPRARRRAQPDAHSSPTSRAASARRAASAPRRPSALIAQKPRWDSPLLDELSRAMADASICGLGQAAPNPIACVIKYFPHELE